MSQKKPVNQTAFLSGAETNVNLSIRRLTDCLNTNKTYAINYFTGVEKRTTQDGKVFPSLFQSNKKDTINFLPGDMYPGFGFWDLDDPTNYAGMQPEGQWSKNRRSIITRKVALIVYGNMDKLVYKSGTTNIDYRYFKQLILDEIVHTLSTKLTLMYGAFDLKAIYQKDIKEIYKGYTVDESDGQFIQYPMFGFRFEGELTVKEQCFAAGPSTGTTIGLGTSYRSEWIDKDTEWLSLVPAGMLLQYIIVENATTNEPQLSIGTDSGLLNIAENVPINAQGITKPTTITFGKVLDTTYDTSIYIHHAGDGDTWDGATIRLTFVWRSV
jgi:hypothetical protein